MGVMFDPFNNGGYTKNQIDDILSHKADLDNDGLVPISQLPQVAFSECITVQNQAERFALTPNDVQKGDIIYQNDTQIMYFVIDMAKLNSEAGYKPFAAGIAAQAVADKDGNEITETYQLKINSQNKLNADNIDDSQSVNKFNVQADWSEIDSEAQSYVKNKPTLGSASTMNVPISGNASITEVVKGDDSRLTDARNAADVYSWAKSPTKPVYDYSEITNTPVIPDSANEIEITTSGIQPSDNRVELWVDLSNTRTINIPETAEDLVYNNTVTPVPSTNVQDAIDNIYDLILPILIINITALSSISITDGTTTITGTSNVGGKFKTQIPNFGTWTITTTLNGDTATEEIIINQIKTYEINMRYIQVYGVSWGFSGKTLARTDKAALFNDPVPYVNDGVMTAADCSSPFDNLAPWSGIEISTDTLGNSLVSIPKFWYKITKTASALTIQIADGPVTGFHVSPAHRARNAQDSDKDIVYIGRYHCDTDYKSKSGVIPKASITRAAARTGVHNLGTEYWQLDISMWITIWMLYIVEFANWDSQAMIGYNCGNNSSKQNTGSTDTMPYHTGTIQTAKTTYGVGVQYRYIEDPWGNVVDWCDGITFNQNNIYCFDNFADYSDSYTSTGAKLVGTRPTSSNYIKNWNLSSEAGYEWFMYPSEVQSAQTEVPDYCGCNTSGVVLHVGGYCNQSAYRGLFYLSGSYGASSSGSDVGVRLQRRPSN